jgi:hypothetical protein
VEALELCEPKVPVGRIGRPVTTGTDGEVTDVEDGVRVPQVAGDNDWKGNLLFCSLHEGVAAAHGVIRVIPDAQVLRAPIAVVHGLVDLDARKTVFVPLQIAECAIRLNDELAGQERHPHCNVALADAGP